MSYLLKQKKTEWSFIGVFRNLTPKSTKIDRKTLMNFRKKLQFFLMRNCKHFLNIQRTFFLINI